MEKKRRRVWTVAISAGAVLIIAAAAASGLFQLVVQAAPEYRGQIESYAAEVTGRPLRIGALRLTWRYYYPALELQNVELSAEAEAGPPLRAERLRLGFDLTRLIRGDFTPSRLEVQGFTLEARRLRDGRLAVEGWTAAGETGDAGAAAALRKLDGFSQLRLERCRLNVLDESSGELLSLGIIEAELQRGLFGNDFEAELTLPPAYAELAVIEAALDGDWLEPRSWSGRWRARITGLTGGNWLAPYLARGARIEVSDADLAVEGQLKDGGLVETQARLRAGAVRGERWRYTAGFESLDALMRMEFTEDGWRAELRRFDLVSAHGPWPAAPVELRYTRAGADGGPPAYEGRAEFVRLADLAPWLQVVRAPEMLAGLAGARGEVRELHFRVQPSAPAEPRYSVRGRFADLALPAAEYPGFAGLSGEFAADDSGGRALLKPGPLQLELPEILVNPTAALERFEGELEWRRRGATWTVTLPQFSWTLNQMRGSGSLELELPPEASPRLELAAQFSADDVNAAKALMPRHWSRKLRDWLDEAIVSGRADRATLRISGPLDDFPFDRKPGTFELDIEASGIDLAFQPDWPPVEELGARLAFRGNSLEIAAVGGSLGGNPIAAATARFPDFATGELIVDGRVTGDVSRFYDYLRRSPLRQDLAALLDNTQARGPATVQVHIDIPLARAEATRTHGEVRLGGVELRYDGFDEPFRDIRGALRFGGPGLRAEKLEATVFGVPLTAAVEPRADGSSLLAAGFRFATAADGKGIVSLVPAWVRRRLEGATDFRAELELGGGDSPLVLRSDLAGLGVALPPPLGKSDAETVPVTVALGAVDGALRVAVDYRDRLGADLRFARRGGAPTLARGALRVGPGETPAPAATGLLVRGSVPELDLRAWSRELAGSGLEQQASLVQRAELSADRVVWGPYALAGAQYLWTPRQRGWDLRLSGASAGEVGWDAAARTLTARLTQLPLELTQAADESEQAPADPAALPRLDLDIGALGVNQAALGRLQLRTGRIASGQSIQALQLSGGIVELTAQGEWRRSQGQSSATLEADLASSDIAALLAAAGYARTLDAKSARLKSALRWSPSAQGIRWQQADGSVHLDFADGQLYTVDPGAGRVLGLFNFYALPRRLTLNFRDVLGSGLGFDRIVGDFRLAAGNAYTENLQIAGPSLRMDVRGRIGLAARDYDQSVTVYPDVSAGVTIGALALGGPVVGVLALIAQELLDKPLDQVTQLSYRVTGSWDNPQVERAEAPPAGPAEPRSGSPSQRP